MLGRFPPPLDGQSVATERLCSLIGEQYTVVRVNTEPPSGQILHTEVRFSLTRLRHYLSHRKHVARLIGRYPDAPILWTAVSAMPLGHWRDLLTTLPVIPPGRVVFAVAHRATFHHLFERWATAFTARILLRHLKGFVFLNRPISQRAGSHVPLLQRWVIPNTVQDALIPSTATVEARHPHRPFRLLFLSNLMPEKGYADVVESLAHLRDRGYAIEAAFVGAWTYARQEAELGSRAEALGLQAIITHAGPIADRTVVQQHLLQADVLVLPTWHPTEAQPLTILEALASGTPVITTRQGGIPTMIDQGVEGFFVPCRAPGAIADAVERLMDPTLWARMSRAARARFDTQFHPDIVRQQWLGLLDGTLPNA